MKKIVFYILQFRPLTVALLKICIRSHGFFYRLISHLAMIREGGVHPKHRITGYHSFFIEAISRQDTVLDLGCGAGLVAMDIAKTAQRVIAIDISKKSIEEAKLFHTPNVTFFEADITKISFEEITCDVVVLSNILEHIKERTIFLSSLHACGAKKLLIRVPLITRDWLVPFIKEIGMNYFSDKNHYIEYSFKELEIELADSGWMFAHRQSNWGELWGVCVPLCAASDR